MIPLAKKRMPSLKDFRPISLTPIISKIFETLVLRSIYPQVMSLFGPSQHAFRKHGATESALVHIHDLVTKCLDVANVAAVRITCLDLTKAFDTMRHDILLNRLYISGINKGLIVWLKSYLTNRTQRLRVNGVFGPTVSTPSGVPQGSVLGPVLFAVFMGSISTSERATIVMYADDFTLVDPIYKEGVSPRELLRITEWINSNDMTLNLGKSRQMVIKRVSEDIRAVHVYPGVELTDQLKILGVTWCSNLTWDKHFSETLRLASQRLYVIRTLRSLLPRDKLISVYKSIVLSILLYAAPLFAWLPAGIEDKLEKFQNRVHAIICGKYCSCSDFPLISDARKCRACSFLLKCESCKLHPLHEFVPERLPRSGVFRQPLANTSRRLHSFFPWTCNLLNHR